MRLIATLAALLVSTPALAQVINPPIVNIDMSQFATKAEASAAQEAATAAVSAANSAVVTAAAACAPMAMLPPIEVPGGTTGSGQNCRLVNAADNRISRVGIFTAGTNGLIGGTWALPLPVGAASYPMFFTGIGASGTLPVDCTVITSTNTGFSAQCRQGVLNLGVLSLALAVAGTQVYALALPSTQASQ